MPPLVSRRQFIGVCAALGLNACFGSPPITNRFNGLVVIIGAGVAGISAAYLLKQLGIPFRVLEAAGVHGGRIKTSTDFVDFPIPLGAEWLHLDEQTLGKIVNDPSVDVTTRLASYRSNASYGFYANSKLQIEALGNYPDLKFVDGTWLTFFEQYLLPSIEAHIQFNTKVIEIDHSDQGVRVKDQNDQVYAADAAIVTVPPQIIRDKDIRFVPPMPSRQRRAFETVDIWGGMKVSLQFDEKFYPTILETKGSNNRRGQKMFYDAAYGQSSADHVLSLFSVGDQAKPYQRLNEESLRDQILAELDEIFDSAATRHYVKHISQNWDTEPFIRQAYVADSASWKLPPRMREPLGDRVFFAGDSYTDGEDWGSVHMAAQSAREAVQRLTIRV